MMLAAFLDTFNHDIALWAASFGNVGELALRLLLAMLAGSMVGLERELRGRMAGFRTHMLVCLGSAMAMVVSGEIASAPWAPTADYVIRLDPARIAYGVMGGIGFLGAGTIIQTRGTVRGLTTAAAMWCVAAIGLGIGLGLYLLAILATLMVVIALWFLDYAEAIMPKKRFRSITVRCPWHAQCVPQMIERFKALGFRVHSVTYERLEQNLELVDISLGITFRLLAQLDKLGEDLEKEPSLQLISAKE
ncbi:MAG: MgtC/SapB family protein [Phycisphaerales bacterium]|nr:MgtC/SapB family protein [Phycisphaerales bacterium]